MERAEVPSCDECDAYEENPRGYAIEKICPECPWGKVVANPLLDKLIRYLELTDAGAPVGRWELTNDEWLLLGALKAEREKIAAERMRENGESG